MNDSDHDPHNMFGAIFFDPQRNRLHRVCSTSENPKAQVGTEPYGVDYQQVPLDFRWPSHIKPLILLHNTMILAYVHLINDGMQGVHINPNDGLPYQDYRDLREKVYEYEQMIGHYFQYNWNDDTVTLVKITDDNQAIADIRAPGFRPIIMVR